ncbi:hypothetical protein BDV19DRAFT_354762 [Aspergillus venezuelensis]
MTNACWILQLFEFLGLVLSLRSWPCAVIRFFGGFSQVVLCRSSHIRLSLSGGRRVLVLRLLLPALLERML